MQVAVVNHEAIRRDFARSERLAESPAGLDDNALGVARDWVGGKDHASRIGCHELLHDDRHGRLFVWEPVLLAVVERPLGPERSPALLDKLDTAARVSRAQVGVIESGERMAGQVFGRGGRANSDERRSEPLEGSANPDGRVLGQFVLGDELPDCGQSVVVKLAQRKRGDMRSIRLGPYDKPLRNRQACPHQRREVQRLGADGRARIGWNAGKRNDADVSLQAREYGDVALRVNKPGSEIDKIAAAGILNPLVAKHANLNTAAINVTKGVAIASELEIATSFAARSQGLLGRAGLKPDTGLLIDPCSSIHMWFMRFPIDVIFLDKKNRVVGLRRNIKPWGMAWSWRGVKTLELPVGVIASTRTQLGDIVAFQTSAPKSE
jgi:uncharacterized membrane protein (UPF0127 family)